MTRHVSPSNQTLARLLTGLGLVGACTVVDKADYTFDDNPAQGGDGNQSGGSSGGGTAGSTGGKGGKAGASGEAGDANGGTSGTSGEAGGGTGGAGGACDPNPCEHGGRCTSTGGEFSCECVEGYTGDTCGTNIDDCDPNPCLNGGTCTDGVADFTCACPTSGMPPTFTGKRCELPRFQPLGMGPTTLARAVSADGSAVLGQFENPDRESRPILWTFDVQGRPVPNPLPIPLTLRPGTNVTPYALSGNGLHWVGEVTPVMGGAPSPIGGSPTSSEMFFAPPNAIAASIFDTNQNGTVSVGYFTGDMTNPGVRALRWNDTGMPMPILAPSTTTMYFAAGAVNRDGTIIAGTYNEPTIGYFLYTWTTEPGSTVPIQRRPPTAINGLEVHGVSNDGMDAVGTYWDTANANFAFITRGGGFENIGPMVGAVRVFSEAWDVSDDGEVIVGGAELMTGTAGGQAVVWKNDGSWRTLFDLLRENGAEPPMGFTLVMAYGVSADGKVIVGHATDPGGASMAFIARLP